MNRIISIDTCLLDAYGERRDDDGGIIVDFVPITNTFSSTSDCCLKEFVFVLEGLAKFSNKTRVSFADFWF